MIRSVAHIAEAAPADALAIAELRAFAVSVPMPEHAQVTLGVGRTVKRDAVLVRVRSSGGLTGWGEAHHGRTPTAIAAIVNDTLAEAVEGCDACDVVGLNDRMRRTAQVTQGSGSAAALAISGIDMAVWDLRSRAVDWPLCRLLGGAPNPVPAYAGGVALGWDDPDALVEEARGLVAQGYRAIKQRIGQDPASDLARLRALRGALGHEIEILADANSRYSLRDALRIAPGLAELDISWLEEPFEPQDARLYRALAGRTSVQLAAGENLFTRQDFRAMIEDGAVSEIQPDLSKAGGITECLRIAGLASAFGLTIHPHASMTGLNAAATLHFLSAIGNGGYLEADVSRFNPLRDDLVTGAVGLSPDGMLQASEMPGLGIEVVPEFIKDHPPIPGSAYRRA